ncbi:MAG: hypothetical protein HZA29_05170 [Candidatus Omnitrophica bacterium]|nr:hypothetical protein [Candidatus Omnitrophota bacterium]
MSSKNKLAVLISLFVLLIIITLVVNQWATREIKQWTNDVPVQGHMSPARATPSTSPKPSATVGHPVVIDPDNDPLAPVVPNPRKQPKPSPGAAKPQRVYEPPMNEVIMVQ